MDFETKKALELLEAELDERYGMALTQIEHSGVDWQARERGVGASSGYGYAIDELRAILRDHSPTGYDVYCAQDAPAFARWERVAWLKDKANTSRYVTDEVESHEVGRWLDDDVLVVYGNRPADGSSRRQVRWYRILPAGSPPPGNEVSE